MMRGKIQRTLKDKTILDMKTKQKLTLKTKTETNAIIGETENLK